GWLVSLGDDADALAKLLADDTIAPAAREALAGGVNYLFKSLDLIPDGIDDIGYLDDAFVLRVGADLAAKAEGAAFGPDGIVSRFVGDCALLREFLGSDYDRLESYVGGLRRGAARGRSVADILGDPHIREDFLADVESFATSFVPPNFGREEKNLIKLKAFF